MAHDFAYDRLDLLRGFVVGGRIHNWAGKLAGGWREDLEDVKVVGDGGAYGICEQVVGRLSEAP